MFGESACSNCKREFNIKYLKYVVNYVVPCWVRGCSSPVGQWAGSVDHQQLTGNVKAATKRLLILEILLGEGGGCPETHHCVTNRLKGQIAVYMPSVLLHKCKFLMA